MTIHVDMVGTIIGGKGATIRFLQDTHRVHVTVTRMEDGAPASATTALQVVGPRRGVDAAFADIECLVTGAPLASAVGLAPAAVAAVAGAVAAAEGPLDSAPAAAPFVCTYPDCGCQGDTAGVCGRDPGHGPLTEVYSFCATCGVKHADGRSACACDPLRLFRLPFARAEGG
jgi:hypothetical protein